MKLQIIFICAMDSSDFGSRMQLDKLSKGLPARVLGISGAVIAVEAKLREIGFAEGDEVELMQTGPLGGAPLCIRLNRTLIALRLDEAAAIEVEPLVLAPLAAETSP